MENKIKRPLSVWIAQILLALVALIYFAVPVVFAITLLLSDEWFRQFTLEMMGANRLLYMVIQSLVYLSLCVAAFWGMTIRKSLGRWLGIAAFSLMFIDGISDEFGAASIEGFERSSSEIVAAILLSCLLMFLILRLAFANNVSAFFLHATDSHSTDAPPPPSFDA